MANQHVPEDIGIDDKGEDIPIEKYDYPIDKTDSFATWQFNEDPHMVPPNISIKGYKEVVYY